MNKHSQNASDTIKSVVIFCRTPIPQRAPGPDLTLWQRGRCEYFANLYHLEINNVIHQYDDEALKAYKDNPNNPTERSTLRNLSDYLKTHWKEDQVVLLEYALYLTYDQTTVEETIKAFKDLYQTPILDIRQLCLKKDPEGTCQHWLQNSIISQSYGKSHLEERTNPDTIERIEEHLYKPIQAIPFPQYF